MGLKEKRFTKSFQEEKYPQLKQQIDQAAGFDVPIEVEWESLFEERFVHLYNDSYPKIYFLPLVKAFETLTSDRIGKEALLQGLQMVVVLNENNHHNPTAAFSFENGVLKVDHSPVVNADKLEDRVEALVTLLENNL